jgi:hypothetical protein
MATGDPMIYQTLAQIQGTLVQVLKILQDIQKNGVKVQTQETHRPG